MTNKCNLCGRFAAACDGARCSVCSQLYHRKCVKISIDAKLSNKWSCNECKQTKGQGAARATNANSNITPISTSSGDAADSDSVCTPTEAATSGSTEDRNDLAREMRLLREQLTTVVQEMVSFRQEVVKLNENFVHLNSRVGDIEKRVVSLEQRASDAPSQSAVPNLEQAVAELRTQLNDRDQASYMNDVVISGVTEAKGENSLHLVMALAQKVGVQLSQHDVVSASRVGREDAAGTDKARPRPIVVRLARRQTRDQLLKEARVRRTADTAGLNLDTEPRRFFINEHMTRINREIFYKTRKESHLRQWRFVWTREGCTYARRDSNTKAFRIRTESDISKVFGA